MRCLRKNCRSEQFNNILKDCKCKGLVACAHCGCLVDLEIERYAGPNPPEDPICRDPEIDTFIEVHHS